MWIKVWGTRGSIATPERDKLKYGGNTTCVEVRFSNGYHFIIDAGTGLRGLSRQLMHSKRELSVNFLFTHAHWDHLCGFPFFIPIYNPKNKFYITGFNKIVNDFRNVIAEQMNGIYFPVLFDSIASKIEFIDLSDIKFKCNQSGIEKIKLNHNGGGYGYKFIEKGKVFVFLTDNELSYVHDEELSFQDFVDFCKGADVLFHDAQYDNDMYQFTKSWGHSTYDDVFELAVASGVKHVYFCHHDPETTDSKLDGIEKLYKKRIKNKKLRLEVSALKEGTVIEL